MTQQTNNAPQAKSTVPTISNFLNWPKTQSFLENILEDKKGEFVSNLIAMTEADKGLSECHPKDLMMVALNATSLNLPLNKNLGYAYVIPYKGIPSFQIGYKGWIQLAIRTGLYKTLNATDIRTGEIDRNKITGEIKFKKDNPEGEVIGYLAFLEMNTGFRSSLYMTYKDTEDHALRYSKMYQADKKYNTKKSKWSDPVERHKMALKTVLKGLLSTYGVITTEMSKAMEYDNDASESAAPRDYEEAEVIPQNDPEPVEPQEEPQQEPKSEPEQVNI